MEFQFHCIELQQHCSSGIDSPAADGDGPHMQSLRPQTNLMWQRATWAWDIRMLPISGVSAGLCAWSLAKATE